MSGIVLSSAEGIAATSFESSKLADSVRGEVENIAYSGKDGYRIEIAMLNKSSQAIPLKEYDIQFHVQTETGWTRLDVTTVENGLIGRECET